ncbi:ROK family protein, partial [Klebsiella pneumoniae]|nr:ROK family protein [Klebsiella pneumoniae]
SESLRENPQKHWPKFPIFDRYELAAMGIGSFGPIGLDPKQANYGHVLATPKAGWQNFDFLGTLKQRYPIPMVWTTDVNEAAYGELKKGAAQDCDTCIYLTVGTGIGAGVIVNNQLFQGKSYPEMGISGSNGTQRIHMSALALIIRIALKGWLPVLPSKHERAKGRDSS